MNRVHAGPARLASCPGTPRARNGLTSAQPGGAFQGQFDQLTDQVRIVQPGPLPEHREHRERRKAGHRVEDRKSTRLNSSHVAISYAVFCLKKKKKRTTDEVQYVRT